jgi:lysophospholipase L1-like esterase
VELACLAEGGAKAQDVVEHQLHRALEERWDVAIVSVGSNDIMRFVPVWRFEQRLDHIVASLKEVADAVVLFGVGDLGSIPRLAFPLDRIASGAGHVADWVHRRVAARHGIAKIDQWRLTTAAFNSGIHMFAPDLFHPSPIGHQAWADALIPTLDEVVAGLEGSR